MQDNQFRPDIGGAFEDKAWQDMHKQLDEEMPVHKKKRRFIFWWWLGSGVAMLFLIATIIFFWTSRESTKTPLSASQKAVVSKNTGTQQPLNKYEPLEQTQTTQKAVLNNPPLHESVSREPKKQTNKRIPHAIRKTKKKSSPPVVESNNALLKERIDQVTNPMTNPSTLVTITHVEQAVAPSSTDSIATSIVEDKLPLKELPLLTKKLISPLPIPITTIAYAAPIISPLPDIAKWQFGLQATLGTFNLIRFNEYSIGFLARRDLSPKWQIRTGIIYQRLRLNQLNRFGTGASFLADQSNMGQVFSPAGTNQEADTSDDAEDNSLDSIMISEPISDQLQSTVEQLKEKGSIHYLSLPVLLEYQLGAKYSINGGANFSYAFKDSYGTLISDALRLRRWDISAALGGTYKVSSKLELQLQYAVGLFEKRKALKVEENNLQSKDIQYSPLEGRIRFSGIWWF